MRHGSVRVTKNNIFLELRHRFPRETVIIANRSQTLKCFPALLKSDRFWGSCWHRDFDNMDFPRLRRDPKNHHFRENADTRRSPKISCKPFVCLQNLKIGLHDAAEEQRDSAAMHDDKGDYHTHQQYATHISQTWQVPVLQVVTKLEGPPHPRLKSP